LRRLFGTVEVRVQLEVITLSTISVIITDSIGYQYNLRNDLHYVAGRRLNSTHPRIFWRWPFPHVANVSYAKTRRWSRLHFAVKRTPTRCVHNIIAALVFCRRPDEPQDPPLHGAQDDFRSMLMAYCYLF